MCPGTIPASAWAWMPFWCGGVVLAPVGTDGRRGAATEPATY